MKKIILLLTVSLITINYSLAIVDMDTVTIEVVNDLPKIKWSTNSQQNSDYFIVERSFDSVNWVDIETEQAEGNSATLLYYEMIDSDFTTSGDSVYYRVCDISFDGSKSCYLPVVGLDLSQLSTIEHDNDKELSLSVYPNPTTDNITIKLNHDLPSSFKLYNNTGKEVMEKEFKNEEYLSLKPLDSGIYFYEIIDQNGNKKTGKIILE